MPARPTKKSKTRPTGNYGLRSTLVLLRMDKWLWMMCGVFLFMAGLSLNDMFVYTPDSARYLIWARSIAEGKGFSDLSTLEPSHYVIHAPLFSLLLSPLTLLPGSGVTASKWLNTVIGLSLLFLVYRWIEQKTGKTGAIVGGFLLLVNPLFVLYSTQILSDVAFGVLIILTFIQVERFAAKAEPSGTVQLVLTMTAAVLIREVGILLVFSVALFFGLKRDYKTALWVLTIPLLCYLLWYMRNELMVASVERPPLKNSMLFTSHFLTSEQTSLPAEFWARIMNNAPIYAAGIGKLVFFPQYSSAPYGVIVTEAGPYSWMAKVVTSLGPLTAVLSVSLSMYGIIVSLKKWNGMLLFAVFAPFYLLLILLYPFHDIRFLFPLLLFLVFFICQAVHHLIQGSQTARWRSSSWAVLGVVAFLIAPNVAWCTSFVRDNYEYRISPEAFYATVAEQNDFPDLLTKPMSLVGRWIVDHSDGTEVIATTWKELTFWLDGRRILDINALMPLEAFENQLRDYGVGYVVAAVGLSGLRELEAQMALSRRFMFEEVQRIANIEILKVTPKKLPGGVDRRSGSPDAEGKSGVKGRRDALSRVGQIHLRQRRIREVFWKGLGLLEDGRPDRAAAVFDTLSAMTGRSNFVVLYFAIANEFSGNLANAEYLLKGFQAVRQAGPYLAHASYHLQIIDLLKSAEREQIARAKASLLHVVSVKYWDLGFRGQAIKVLEKSLQADPAFAPSLVFGMFYHLQRSDTLRAREFLLRLKRSEPLHPMIVPLSDLFRYYDLLKRERQSAERIRLHRETARCYEEIGLRENAIDELMKALEIDAGDPETLDVLARIYEAKNRYYPARSVLRHLVERNPGSTRAKEELEELERRW